jgi:hypothetical protein
LLAQSDVGKWVIREEHILKRVLAGLDRASLLSACLVCREWCRLGEKPVLWAHLPVTVTLGRLAALQGLGGLPDRVQALRVYASNVTNSLCEAMASRSKPLRSVELYGQRGVTVSPATLAAALGGVKEIRLTCLVTGKANGQAAALARAWAEESPPSYLQIGPNYLHGFGFGFGSLASGQVVLALRRVPRLKLNDLSPALVARLFEAIAEGCAVEELDISARYSLVGPALLHSAVKRLRVAKVRGLSQEAVHGLLELVARGGHGELEGLDIKGTYVRAQDKGLVARAAGKIKDLKTGCLKG